jgi:hypothetical protein
MLRKVCMTVKNCRQASPSLSRFFVETAGFAHLEKWLFLLRFVSKRGDRFQRDFHRLFTAKSRF